MSEIGLLELDSKLVALSTERDKLYKRYREVESEIDDLNCEFEDIESDLKTNEEEYNRIKELVLKLRSAELDKLNASMNPFLRNFIKASLFTSKLDDVRPVLSLVNLTDTQIQACDTYRAIVITTDIPDVLKNTKIPWDVRENFQGYINKNAGDYLNLNALYQGARDSRKATFTDINSESFYERFDVYNYPKETKHKTVCMNAGEITIAVNKEYLDTALMCFEDSKFSMSVCSPVSPILLENNQMSILILPLRIIED